MAASRRERGALIAVEGEDRSGKTALCKGIVADLMVHGVRASYFNYPQRHEGGEGREDVSKMIEKRIHHVYEESTLNQSLQVLHSADRWDAAAQITGLIKSGSTLVVDRYVYSSLAYSMAVGLDAEWTKKLESFMPKPDRVYYLTWKHDPSKAKKVSAPLQTKIYESAMKLKDASWMVLDASEPRDELLSRALSNLTPLIEAVRYRPMCDLWTK